MDTTELKLAFTDPEETRSLFGALLSYAQNVPVLVFGKDEMLLHGEETARTLAGMNPDFKMVVKAVYGITPHEFDASDWVELLEAARQLWVRGETPGESYLAWVKQGAGEE